MAKLGDFVELAITIFPVKNGFLHTLFGFTLAFCIILISMLFVFYQCIQFFGNVQGVGFRYTAYRLAQRYTIAGFVRNLPEGSVWLEVEGDKNEVMAYTSALKKKMAQYISSLEAKEGERPPSHQSFKIL